MNPTTPQAAAMAEEVLPVQLDAVIEFLNTQPRREAQVIHPCFLDLIRAALLELKARKEAIDTRVRPLVDALEKLTRLLLSESVCRFTNEEMAALNEAQYALSLWSQGESNSPNSRSLEPAPSADDGTPEADSLWRQNHDYDNEDLIEELRKLAVSLERRLSAALAERDRLNDEFRQYRIATGAENEAHARELATLKEERDELLVANKVHLTTLAKLNEKLKRGAATPKQGQEIKITTHCDHHPMSMLNHMHTGGDGTCYYATSTHYRRIRIGSLGPHPDWATHFVYFGK